MGEPVENRVVAVVLGDGPSVIAGVVVDLEGPTPGHYYSGVTNEDGYLALEVAASLGASQLTLTKAGYVPYSVHVDLVTLPWVANQSIRVGGPRRDATDICLPALEADMPAPSTRDQVCAVEMWFQGLRVDLPDYGRVPWFGPFINS